MPRVKGGYVTRRRRKRVLKLAKGYYGAKHILYRTAKQQVMKSLTYAYRDRKQTKRNFRKLWITRINAACRMQNISYSKFMHGLKLANVDVNRKMLADLAVNDLAAFNQLVAVAKEALANPVKKAVVIEEKKVAAEVKPVEVAVEATEDLSKLTVAELKNIAKERGITVPSGARKADIIELLSK